MLQRFLDRRRLVGGGGGGGDNCDNKFGTHTLRDFWFSLKCSQGRSSILEIRGMNEWMNIYIIIYLLLFIIANTRVK